MLTSFAIQSLALNLVLHHLGDHLESTATWIDTTGDFSPENACQLLACIEVIHLFKSSNMFIIIIVYHFQKSPSTLERLQISLAFDIDAAQVIVDHSIQNIDVRAISPFISRPI